MVKQKYNVAYLRYSIDEMNTKRLIILINDINIV